MAARKTGMQQASRGKKQVKKRGKKRGGSARSGVAFLCTVMLLVGVVIGETVYHFLTRKDVFELIGADYVEIKVGTEFSYVDEGVRAIRYGIEYSDRVIIETDMQKERDCYLVDTSKPGKYSIVYRIDVPDFQEIQKVRVFEVVA